jgi:hypothetical protein
MAYQPWRYSFSWKRETKKAPGKRISNTMHEAVIYSIRPPKSYTFRAGGPTNLLHAYSCSHEYVPIWGARGFAEEPRASPMADRQACSYLLHRDL